MKEILEITNKKYVEILEKIKKKLDVLDIDSSEKNNLKMATEKLIKIYRGYFEVDCIDLIENTRSVYEISTKALTLSENTDLKESYEKIEKSKKEQKDNPVDVRQVLKDNFNNFFSIIEEDPEFQKIAGRHILDYIYRELSNFTHTSKEKEFLYVLLQDEKYKEFTTIMTLLEFTECVMIIHLDLINTKYNMIENELDIFSAIFTFKLFVFLIYLIDNKKLATGIMYEAEKFFENNENNANYANIRRMLSRYELQNFQLLFEDESVNKEMSEKLITELNKIFNKKEAEILSVHLEKYTVLVNKIKQGDVL